MRGHLRIAPMAMLVLIGCTPECPPTQPNVEVLVESATYRSPLAGVNRVGILASHPWLEGQDFALEVDRTAGEVTLRYERNGEQVEETWRITGAT